MIKYKLSNGAIVPVPEGSVQAFLLEVQSKGLTATLVTDESETIEPGKQDSSSINQSTEQINETNQSPNNQQTNTESNLEDGSSYSQEPEYYQYGIDPNEESYY